MLLYYYKIVLTINHPPSHVILVYKAQGLLPISSCFNDTLYLYQVNSTFEKVGVCIHRVFNFVRSCYNRNKQRFVKELAFTRKFQTIFFLFQARNDKKISVLLIYDNKHKTKGVIVNVADDIVNYGISNSLCPTVKRN